MVYCALTLKLDPAALDGQDEVYLDGIEVVVSSMRASKVAIAPSVDTYTSQERPTIVVNVWNKTDEPFNFSTEEIQVFCDNKPLKVFTYNELVAETKRKQAWTGALVAMGGAMESVNAQNSGYVHHSGTYNTSVYGSNGYSANGYGTYSGTTYDPYVAQQAKAAAEARTEADIQAIQTQTESKLNALSSTMLKKTTIMPQTSYGGIVTLDKIPNPEKRHEIKVLINASGEHHEFLFNHSKVASSGATLMNENDMLVKSQLENGGKTNLERVSTEKPTKLTDRDYQVCSAERTVLEDIMERQEAGESIYEIRTQMISTLAGESNHATIVKHVDGSISLAQMAWRDGMTPREAGIAYESICIKERNK